MHFSFKYSVICSWLPPWLDGQEADVCLRKDGIRKYSDMNKIQQIRTVLYDFQLITKVYYSDTEMR